MKSATSELEVDRQAALIEGREAKSPARVGRSLGKARRAPILLGFSLRLSEGASSRGLGRHKA
jgi:hypothetical protein